MIIHHFMADCGHLLTAFEYMESQLFRSLYKIAGIVGGLALGAPRKVKILKKAIFVLPADIIQTGRAIDN
jgi:hypothetical protein